MKKAFLLGVLCFAATACDKREDAAPQTRLETTIVSSGEKSSLKLAAKNLKIQLLEVNDSRCPINADCVSAGAADLKFNVSDGASEADVAVLFSSADKSSGSKEFKLAGQNYLISVSEVLPYPEIQKPVKLEDFKIGVSISEK